MSDFSNKAKDVTGKLKEKAGSATGNDRLQSEGQGDQAVSKAKQAAGNAKGALQGAADKIKGKGKLHN